MPEATRSVRIPERLYQEIVKEAEANGRTLLGELKFRLERPVKRSVSRSDVEPMFKKGK